MVLMQWKLSDGRYVVIFGDGREREVGAGELIKLQARMLQKRAKWAVLRRAKKTGYRLNCGRLCSKMNEL